MIAQKQKKLNRLKMELHQLNENDWLFKTAYEMKKEYLEVLIKLTVKEIQELER